MALTAAEKKRAQRLREKKEIASKGGQRVTALMFGDTMALLERECARYGFSGKQRFAETLTHILHIRDDRTDEEKNQM